MHVFHAAAVLRPCGNDIDTRGVDAGMTENVRKLGNIFFDPVEHAGKEMPQVMRKDLRRVDLCRAAQGFHLPPNIRPTDRFAGAGNEEHPAINPVCRRETKQFFLQRTDNQYGSRFPFESNGRFASPDRFHGDKTQFADANTRSANGLQNKVQPLVVPFLRRTA